MAVTVNFKREDIQARFDAFLDEVQKQQVRRLQKLGEMCITHARSVSPDTGFHDQTGNLRSSIGYMVFVNGMAVHASYKQVKDGLVGTQMGEALARKVGAEHQGVCLVVTAGMNYALYVESKGRDVITSAEQLAQHELPRMLEKLVTNIKRAAE